MTAQTSDWNPKKGVSENPYFGEFLSKFSGHNAESERNNERNSLLNKKKEKTNFRCQKH